MRSANLKWNQTDDDWWIVHSIPQCLTQTTIWASKQSLRWPPQNLISSDKGRIVFVNRPCVGEERDGLKNGAASRSLSVFTPLFYESGEQCLRYDEEELGSAGLYSKLTFLCWSLSIFEGSFYRYMTWLFLQYEGQILYDQFCIKFHQSDVYYFNIMYHPFLNLFLFVFFLIPSFLSPLHNPKRGIW